MTASRPADPAALVLGYLNFSSGSFDPAAWRAINDLFAAVETASGEDGAAFEERPDTASAVAAMLRKRLGELEASEPAFRQASQARAAIEVVFDRLPLAYRRYHADLLAHQPPGGLERPFFLMAAGQAVLAEAASGEEPGLDDSDRLVERVITRLNDYAGWRPVAVLENGRLSEPYPHERVRPVPIFIAGVGPAHGRYRDLVQGAVEILAVAPPDLLRQADFDMAMLEELAIDPRAFDFLHPAASRPNYLFGLWDPGRIDERGCYRRMVVQQATLDGILSWPVQALAGSEATAEDHAELGQESAAVLAGVMLMASGLSGHGPGAQQAGLPLAELLPRIAGYRDAFYRWLMERLPERHRLRLEEESRRLRQPFGGVRRHINALLAGRRARQVESVGLAAVMSRLGRSAEAERLAGIVPAASARMLAHINGHVVAAQQILRRAKPTDDAATASSSALDHLDEATDLLFRGVGCGAMVDPWNILGLAGQFPLHEPGGESLPDPRVDDLVGETAAILEGYAAVWRQASLDGAEREAARATNALERLATWWDRHATTTVSGVEYLSGREIRDSAREVIASLSRRRQSGGDPPPPGFWRKEVASFSSPRSHAQAAESLLREGDLDGAMGLLVNWASLLEGPTLEQLGSEWLAAAARWLTRAFTDRSPAGRSRLRRFLELIEANTGGVVDVVETAAAGRDLGGASPGDASVPSDADDDGQTDAGESVASAYESMVWRDSTDDGVDGGMLEFDLPGGAVGDGPAEIEEAASFLAGCARLIRHVATASCAAGVASGEGLSREEIDAVIGWRHAMRRQRRAMVRAAMLLAVQPAEAAGMTPSEVDRLQMQRDAAAERLVDAAVEMTETLWMLSAWMRIGLPQPASSAATGSERAGLVGRLFAAIFRGDVARARELLDEACSRLANKAVLYVPLARGGRPDRIVRARGRERLLARLAACLPRIGLVAESAHVVHLAKSLERKRPAGGASVSEFDRVFEAGTMALVERIVESAHGPAEGGAIVEGEAATQRILDGLSLLVPKLLETWMTHARQLRLSVLERIREEKSFATMREFIEHYGSGLFTQHVLAPPSLRGILRGGVKPFLERMLDRDRDDDGSPETSTRRPARLLEALATGTLPMKVAQSRIRLILESIAENHAEYRDWNSTTTQSDRGENLHVLLDFLRLKAEYDRIAWTLRPVTMAHRVLARRGESAAAAAWRGRMRDETAETAAALGQRLAEIERESGVRLASVGDRVRRAFTAPLEQDELEAFVDPAVMELFSGEPRGAGAAFEKRARAFLGVASGAGVEVPEWLERLTDRVDRSLDRADGEGAAAGGFSRLGSLPDAVPWLAMPWEALREALAK
jgi:hypothetical protein